MYAVTSALAAIEQPARGGVVGDGGHDLDELITDVEQSVVQAELGDTRVLEAHRELELCGDAVDSRVEVTGGDDDLAEADHASMVEAHALALGSTSCLR